jgi:hypothetical protein
MKDDCIISLLEDTPFGELSENDLVTIRLHVGDCDGCLTAFEAAQVSRLLLHERVEIEYEPPPFFHTRVLATLRERQTANDSWAFSKMWRAAGALASSMAAAVAMLAVFTFAIPETQVTSQQRSTVSSAYSAEDVILGQTAQLEDDSDGQLLTTIYGADEEPTR